MFHGEVTDAAPCVENVGFHQGGGRAGVETGRAVAAVVGDGFIGREFDIGEESTEKELGAEPAVEKHGVLADPTETRPGRPLAFEQWRGVDHRAP